MTAQLVHIIFRHSITTKTSETLGDIFNDIDTITLDVNITTYADGKIF